MSISDWLKRKLGAQEQAAAPAGDAMKVLNLRLRQVVRIASSDAYEVAGIMTCEREGHEWYNCRLVHRSGTEHWLSVEFWEDGMRTFLWTPANLFETPDRPVERQAFAVTPDRKVPYRLTEEGVGTATVRSMVNADEILHQAGLEPVQIEPGTQFTFWQYCAEEDPTSLLAIEIWSGEKSYSTGREVDPNSIAVTG